MTDTWLETCTTLERMIHRDPAGRGPCSIDHPLIAGDLASAAQSLARNGTSAAIVTGFYIPHGKPAAVETDGITGSLFLARALRELGHEVAILTDRHAQAVLRLGIDLVGLPPQTLLDFPFPGDGVDADALKIRKPSHARAQQWVEDFFQRGLGRQLTHLIAVERVGPSHTPDSLEKQSRSAEAPWEQFHREVPSDAHDQCHNMAGVNISQHTAPMHLLFDYLCNHGLNVTTIGIGDGGNEIGMGKIPWEQLRQVVNGDHAGRIFCRIATDLTIIGGTSNWGAYALAAAVLGMRGHPALLRQWNRNYYRHILENLVQRGPIVDGVTGKQQATVDGLDFETYFSTIAELRRAVLTAMAPIM